MEHGALGRLNLGYGKGGGALLETPVARRPQAVDEKAVSERKSGQDNNIGADMDALASVPPGSGKAAAQGVEQTGGKGNNVVGQGGTHQEALDDGCVGTVSRDVEGDEVGKVGSICYR